MDFQIIKKPAQGVLRILEHRSAYKDHLIDRNFDAIGLVQGKIAEMLVAADVAEKASDVTTVEVRGNCPQHITVIAILGDTAAVEEAMACIQNQLERPISPTPFDL